MEKDNRAYTYIYGAMCFAGSTNPGCGVIVGECREHRSSKPEFHLIAEVEERSTKDLIQACSNLDLKHLPFLWFGDTDDIAGREFIDGLNEELERKYNLPGVISKKLIALRHRGTIELTKSAIVKMPGSYHYILPILRELLNKEHRRLFLPKRTAIKDYMKAIKKVDDIAAIRLSDFPAVSALGIACIELENRPDLSDAQESAEDIAEQEYYEGWGW